MRKSILLAIISLGNLISAQQTPNDQLNKELEDEKNEIQAQYDLYIYNNASLQSNSTNSATKELNKFQKDLISKKNKVGGFFRGQPYFLSSFDTDQIKNTNVDAINSGSITGLNGSFNGDGIHISVFDGGRVYENHAFFMRAGNSRVANKEKSNIPYDDHATGVTSIIGGAGYNIPKLGNPRGMAIRSTFDSYFFESTELEGENTKKTVLQKLLASSAYLSNHSYGYVIGWKCENECIWNGEYNPITKESNDLNGTYYITDRSLDNIVYNNPHMIVVKAAGNSFGDGSDNTKEKYYNNGNTKFSANDKIPESNCSQGYDCIAHGSVAKNIITVGATEKITTNGQRYTQASDIVKASYSSAGPRDDGAIKPDIASVGSDVIFASTSNTGSSDIGQGSGTSFSAPQVTGIIALWLEIYKSLFNNQALNAASVKNLLIHSAQEAGNFPGPDAWFGWGFADAKKGAELLVDKSNEKIIFEDKILANKSIDKIFLESNGSEPIKVSISWIDPSFKNIKINSTDNYNNRSSKLVNDLDLRVINISTNEIFYPWKLDINNPLAAATQGDNLVDNVEQVLINNPTAGFYRIEVSHKSNLMNNEGNIANSQNYSIIATGYDRLVSENETIKQDNSKSLVYPTLLTDTEKIVNLDFSQNIANVSVYDISGRLLKSEHPNSTSHSINFQAYNKGVYVIHVKLNNNETVVKKIMKR